MEMYLRVNLLGRGPRLIKKRIYRAGVSQRLRNTDVKYPLFLSDFNGIRMFYTIFLFEKFSNIELRETPPSGSRVFRAEGRTGEQTDTTKVTAAFRNFANAPTER